MNEFTKEQRQQIAEAFKAAKDFLWDGLGGNRARRERYICYALAEAACAKRVEQFSRLRAAGVINHRLGQHAYLEGWLQHYARIPLAEINSDLPRLQATRPAWLDSLIEEFSA
jgi:hypothetical protein